MYALARNSGPRGLPELSKRWPTMPLSEPSCWLDQMTTKLPAASEATVGAPWESVVCIDGKSGREARPSDEALAEDAAVDRHARTRPDDDEVAGQYERRHSTLPLLLRVYAEFGAERNAGAGVALAEDAADRAVLRGALPYNAEVSGEAAARTIDMIARRIV